MTPSTAPSAASQPRGRATAAGAGCKAWLRSFWRDLTLNEISGSLGDLGTFLPLTVGLVKNNGLDLGMTLIFTGLYNITTGIVFRVPMPVQPMKMIAAAAMSDSPLTIPQIMAAGMFVSAAVLLLGATGMMSLVQSLLPDAVIKGMQLGLGLSLAKKGFQQVWYLNSKSSPARDWWGVEGLCLGIFALLFILLAVYTRRDSSPARPGPLLPTSTPHPAAGAAAGTLEEADNAEKLNTSPPPEAALDSEAPAPPGSSGLARPLFSHPLRSSGRSGWASGGGLGRWGSGEVPANDWPRNGASSDGGASVQGGSSGDEAHAPILGGARAPSEVAALDAPLRSQRGWRGRGAVARSRLQAALDRLDCQLSTSIGGEPTTGSAGRGATPGGGAGRPCGSPLGESGGFHVPAALVTVVIGVLLTLIYKPDIVHSLHFGPSMPHFVVPSAQDWSTGIIKAGLPQLPLTTFNSVISVCQLAGDLFPDKPASPNAVATSVGAMNLVGGWFGAMPSCMGAGGLAAQARFGARTGAAPIFLGLLKLALGLLFGSSLFSLLQAFPQPLMGAMLVYAGVQLAACARNQRGERGVAILLLTAMAILTVGNVAIGVAAGLIAAYSLLACDLFREWLLPRLRPPAGLRPI